MFFHDNHIKVYKNIFTSEECDYYIKKIESIDQKQLNFCNNGNYLAMYLYLENEPLIASKLTKCIDNYKKIYNFLDLIPFRWGTNNQFNFQKYDPGYSFNGEHCEHGATSESCNRIIAWMIYLNTIKNGGGTYWPQQKYQTNANEGSVVIWPAGWTHSHYGIISKDQYKYILTGWCSFDVDS